MTDEQRAQIETRYAQFRENRNNLWSLRQEVQDIVALLDTLEETEKTLDRAMNALRGATVTLANAAFGMSDPQSPHVQMSAEGDVR